VTCQSNASAAGLARARGGRSEGREPTDQTNKKAPRSEARDDR
jgi:hypothetical protein